MKSSLNVLLAAVLLVSLRAKSQDSKKRYSDLYFGGYVLTKDVSYGALPEHRADVYSPPSSDAERLRPLVIYIHGGGFKNQTKFGAYQTRVCTTLAKMGYVAASIEYRLTNPIPDATAYFEAMMRGLQDAKAAVRFFRKSAKEYGIDPNRIYATGSSAGSIIALHLAYLDSAEVPEYIRWDNVGGSFEGNNGSPGYSSDVQGVINAWGAIGDTSWMRGSNVPVFSIHGLNDTTVYYERVPSYKVFKFGSRQIGEAAARNGIRWGVRTFSNTGHTLDNSGAKQDSAIADCSRWLYLVQRDESGKRGKRE
ncbi:alpha/beta hydrolase [bacterium]|nr:MAG: alpha/beta hydrolase [bacterium]